MLHPALAQVLARGDVWQGNTAYVATEPGVPTGFGGLDSLLPGRGWPQSALTELLLESSAQGEFSLLLPLLIRQTRKGWAALVAPPWLPYGPALREAGVILERLVVLDQVLCPLRVMEQLLASRGFSLVLAWQSQHASYTALRRVQVAAEGSAAVAMLCRPGSHHVHVSPAPLRLQLTPTAGERPGMQIRVLKRRGPSCDQAVSLSLPRPGEVRRAVSGSVFSKTASRSPVLSAIA